MKMIDHNHFICHLILGTFTEYPYFKTASFLLCGLSNIVYKYTLITLAIGNIRISLCGYGNKVLLPSCHNSADDILLLPRK